jgi:fatty acid desaturase
MRQTTQTPRSIPWLNVAYWATAAMLAVLGLITFFGAFGSSSEIVSYIIFGMVIVLCTTRFIVLRRRARSHT